MAIDIKKLNRLINEANEDEDTTQEFDEFSTLDLRKVKCFGYSVPLEQSWVYIANQALQTGWGNVDTNQLEKNLTKDVEQSYMSVAQFKMVNVSDGLSYIVTFDNNKAMWNVVISDSPKAELTAEQQENFFKSELFTKAAKRSYYKITEAMKIFNQVIKSRLNDGSMLLVDVVKLDAITHFIESKHFLENLRNGKFYAI